MRLEQLEYFVAAAESGSIRAAAQRLKISQPAVSAALRSLEDEVGGHLFGRGSQGISLTALGRQTCEDARKIMELVQGIRAEAECRVPERADLRAAPFILLSDRKNHRTVQGAASEY